MKAADVMNDKPLSVAVQTKTVRDHLVWVAPNSGLVIGADTAR